MSDKRSSNSRRKLLKSIATGSGAIVAGKSLPDSWTKPVVDSVLLPAHAQTSACSVVADCYPAESISGFFTWPGGGPGPFSVEYFQDSTCIGIVQGTIPVVLASSLTEAQTLLGLPGDPNVELFSNASYGGCQFYWSD